MQSISAASLESLPSRIQYLSSFLGLHEEDAQFLLAARPLLTPLIPSILDAVYVKLLSYDITAHVFVPKNRGFEGEAVQDVKELCLDSPQIVMRKDFLKNYLVKLVSTEDLAPNSKFWEYMDNVAVMHTGRAGFKHREKRPDLRVEYVHMSALLGYVVDIVIGAVMEMEIDNATKVGVLKAFNKVIWIQNDLFAWAYQRDGEGQGLGEREIGKVNGEMAGGGCPF